MGYEDSEWEQRLGLFFFLTSALDGCTGGWVGFSAHLDVYVESQPPPHWDSNLKLSSP